MMARISGVLLLAVILSACGRQPAMTDVLPHQASKQCLDIVQDVTDCI